MRTLQWLMAMASSMLLLYHSKSLARDMIGHDSSASTEPKPSIFSEEQSRSTISTIRRSLLQTSSSGLTDQISTSGLRVLVNSTQTYPFNSVGFLRMWRADYSLLQGCTGVLIGPAHVLTAAHCLWNSGLNEPAPHADFLPAYNPFATGSMRVP